MIPCYDSNATAENYKNYIVLSTQSNTVDKANKCEYRWESSILIDIVTRYDISGNPGSRVMADDILDHVRIVTDNLTLDAGSGLKIITQTQSFPNDIESMSDTQIVYRKLMRIEFLID